jgi:hypothetical protein
MLHAAAESRACPPSFLFDDSRRAHAGGAGVPLSRITRSPHHHVDDDVDKLLSSLIIIHQQTDAIIQLYGFDRSGKGKKKIRRNGNNNNRKISTH